MEDNQRTNLIMEELRRQKGKEALVDVEAEHMKIVIVTLGSGLYAFPGADIKEILPSLDISPVPGAPGFIPGIINNRGDIESVISLNKFLGLSDRARTAASRIVMASKAGVRSGILVDAVLDVVDVPLNMIRPPLSTLDHAIKELVAGEMIYGGRTVVMLDIGRLFHKLVIQDE